MILALLLAAQSQVVAVLEFRDKVPAEQRIDAGYLSDQVRSAVKDLMPQAKVITRENMLVLLTASGKDLAACEGACEVDTGRRIGADLVVSGELLHFGTQYKLNMKLHSTRSGELIAGAVASGALADDLDRDLRPAVGRLLAPLLQDALSDQRAAARGEAPGRAAREKQLPGTAWSGWVTAGYAMAHLSTFLTSGGPEAGFQWGLGGSAFFRVAGPVYLGAFIDDQLSGPQGLLAGGGLRAVIGDVALSGGFGYASLARDGGAGFGGLAAVDIGISGTFALRLQGSWRTAQNDIGALPAHVSTFTIGGSGGLSLNF